MSYPLLQGKPVPALGFSLQTLSPVSPGVPLAATAARKFYLCPRGKPGVGQKLPQKRVLGHGGVSGAAQLPH